MLKHFGTCVEAVNSFLSSQNKKPKNPVLAFMVLIALAGSANAQETVPDSIFVNGTNYSTVASVFGTNPITTSSINAASDKSLTFSMENYCVTQVPAGAFLFGQTTEIFVREAAVQNGTTYVRTNFQSGPAPKPLSCQVSNGGFPNSLFGLENMSVISSETWTCSNVVNTFYYHIRIGCRYQGSSGQLISTQYQNAWLINGGVNPTPTPTPTPKLDLAVTQISVVAPSAPDTLPLVKPDIEYIANVQVSGSGFQNPESRSTTIRLIVDSMLFEQPVSLASIAASGSIMVPIKIKLTPEQAGKNKISASINPTFSFNEENILNNVAFQDIQMLCSVSEKNRSVTHFPQGKVVERINDVGRWGEQQYASSVYPKLKADNTPHPLAGQPVPMSKLGCLTSSLAMLFDSYGIKTTADGKPMDPGSLNLGLKSLNYSAQLGPEYSLYNGYTPSNDVQPNGAVAFARDAFYKKCRKTSSDVMGCLQASKSAVSYKDSIWNFSEADSRKVMTEICSGNPVILQVPSISKPMDPKLSHFILATGTGVDRSGNTQFIVNDPNNVEGGTLALGSRVKGYRLYRPTDDPAMIFIHVTSNVDMIVTDPDGRRMGYNPFTNQSFSEIPGGRFITSESISDPTDSDVSTIPETRFEGLQPLAGQYKVQIFAKANASYQLTSYSFDSSGTINGITDKKANINANSSAEILVQHSAQAIPVRHAALIINKANFFDTKYKDMAFISGKIQPADGRSILSVEKYISIKIGAFSKVIEKKNLLKIKARGQTYYTYLSLRKGGAVLELNVDTGDFNLFVSNIEFDNGETSLTTDMSIQIDDIFASDIITFKNILRKK